MGTRRRGFYKKTNAVANVRFHSANGIFATVWVRTKVMLKAFKRGEEIFTHSKRNKRNIYVIKLKGSGSSLEKKPNEKERKNVYRGRIFFTS